MEVQKLTKRKVAATVALTVAFTVLFALFYQSAEARPSKAKIYMTQEKIPRKLTEKELVAFVKKHQTKRLEETKDSNIKKRIWKANVVFAFKRPLGAMEFDLVFYEIKRGVRILVERRNTLLNDSTQKTYLEKIKLRRPSYKPNRKMVLAVEVNRAEVGRFKFSTIGE